jgi:enoyl-CoA hydratase/carnithine racemase
MQPNTNSDNDLLYEVRDGIGLVTLNRPRQRNALTFDMYARLAEICRTIPQDGSVKALIITGAGDRAFAAGTDISLFKDFKTPEQGIAYEAKADRYFTDIEGCPVPTIAAIAGACTGGGAGIAVCCDIRLASADMKYGFPIARTLGNCLSAATLARLVTAIGEPRVTELLFTARLMTGDEALRVGLVSEVLPDHASLLARAQALAETIKGHAPLTMSVTKTLLRRMRQAAAKVEDADLVAKVYTSADFREGLTAFLAKRPAKWTGR